MTLIADIVALRTAAHAASYRREDDDISARVGALQELAFAAIAALDISTEERARWRASFNCITGRIQAA